MWQWLLLWVLPWEWLSAQVITDGSVGAAETLTGPNFTIPASLGQQNGHNLFHSFSQFDLNKAQSATFLGDDSIQHIISRITAGNESVLDGLIQTDIDGANLYLLNPHGFLLGPNVSLNVNGDVYVSTASEVQLGENAVFYSNRDQTSVLHSAPPEAFGFLDTPATLRIENNILEGAARQTLSLSAATIELDNGHLVVPAGQLHLVAVEHASHIALDPQLDLPNDAQGGTIRLSSGSSIEMGKRQGEGSVFIRAGQFVLDNSTIVASTNEERNGGVIDISVDTLQFLNNSFLDTRTFGNGDGGDVQIRVRGDAQLESSEITSTALSSQPQAGAAGDISLQAQNLTLQDSRINTTTFGVGHGGDIVLQIDDALVIRSTPEAEPSIQASSQRTNGDAGNAGQIVITAQSLLLDGAQIDNSSLGDGQGNSITLTIRDQVQLINQARIAADSQGSGDTGTLTLTTACLYLDHSTISTAAQRADGGDMRLNISNKLIMRDSQITVQVNGGDGNGGSFLLSNPQLVDLINSEISANADQGDGGLIFIIAGQLRSVNSSMDAESEAGLDGVVQTDFLNVEGEALPMAFLNAEDLIPQRCEARSDTDVSRFVVIAQRGRPHTPEDLQNHFPAADEDEDWEE